MYSVRKDTVPELLGTCVTDLMVNCTISGDGCMSDHDYSATRMGLRSVPDEALGSGFEGYSYLTRIIVYVECVRVVH